LFVGPLVSEQFFEGEFHRDHGNHILYNPPNARMTMEHPQFEDGDFFNFAKNSIFKTKSERQAETATKKTLGGGFEYFFIFTPTWGSDSIWLR